MQTQKKERELDSFGDGFLIEIRGFHPILIRLMRSNTIMINKIMHVKKDDHF